MAPRNDPFRQVRYILEIEDVVTAGFSRCRLPVASSSVVEYREGNEPPTPRKLPGLNEYGPLVLEKGVTDRSTELYEWRALVESGLVDDARRSVAVVLLDTQGDPGARWEFREAWPSGYEGPDLSATGNDVAIERLVVANEGFARIDTEREFTTDAEPVTSIPTGDLPRLGLRGEDGLRTKRRSVGTDDSSTET